MNTDPKVCVVTPVYNGGRFIADAISSVLSQTYANWSYVIADNGSTDDTLAIAESYAAQDSRIRVVRSPHVPIMDNWNRALGLVDEDAKYVKELHADDLLLPNCLAELVLLMERYPSAGMASSFCLYDAAVSNIGLPYNSGLHAGHDIIRGTLLGKWYVFGAPSQVMIRHDVIRELGPAFYDKSLRHADVDVWYRILERHDFGFVYQILSCERTHEDSQTNTFTARYSTLPLEHFCFLRHYGPRYIDAVAYRRGHRRLLNEYRRRIARRMVGGAGRAYWRYHARHLERFGYRLTFADLAIGVGMELARWAADGNHADWSRAKLQAKFRHRLRTMSAVFAEHGQRLLATRHRFLRQSFYQVVSTRS